MKKIIGGVMLLVAAIFTLVSCGGVPVDFPILDEYGNLDCEKTFNTTFVSNYLNSLK